MTNKLIVTRYGIEVDLTHPRKVGCPKCMKGGRDRGQNNFQVYGIDTEGRHLGGYCWSCDYTIPSEQWLEENGEIIEDEWEDLVGLEFNEDVHNKLKKQTGLAGKGYRGIPDSVSKFFGVRYGYDETTGEVNETYYPCTIDGGISGYKVRSHPKDFANPGPYGETGQDVDMFGQFRFETFGHTVVITGGEHDQLAAYTMLLTMQKDNRYDPTAVVSSTIGESGAWKQIQKNYSFFNKFKKIILCFDNDRAGKEATEKAVSVLPRGKVYVMNLRLKDCNEYILAGKTSEFISDFWNCKQYTPDGVHASSSLYNAALSYSHVERLTLPPFMRKAQEMFGGGLVKNEISVCFAFTSVGKSLFIDNMVVHTILNDPKELVGIMSLEAAKEKYATNILSRYLGINLNRLQGQHRIDYLSQPDVKEKIDKFLLKDNGESRFYVYDNRGADIDAVKESILEMVIKLGITFLVVDVYSDLTAGMDLSAQEELVSWLKKLILEYPKVSILMVAHTRKQPSGNSTPLVESDIIGSGSVMKSAAQTFSLERDKLHENPVVRNQTVVTIHKNRHNSDTGPAGLIYYEPETGNLYEWEDYVKENPHMVISKEG